MEAETTAIGFSKKPHFLVPQLPSTTRQIPSKSPSNFCKSLIVVLVLLLIPLFPSQAPDFISQIIVTEFWEIFHLLVVGIAISYGLFCRKTAPTGTEQTVYSTNDASLSGISHLSSIFEDGFENFSCSELSGEQNMVNSQYLQCGDSKIVGKDRCVAVEGKNSSKSFVSSDVNENVSRGNGKRGTQAWFSQYSKGESNLVVVSNGNYFLDEINEFKPLNLPVRSLRSKVGDDDGPVLKNMNEDVKGKDNAKVVRIRGVVPMNLEKKFEEVAGPSPIPWRSRSGRMERGLQMDNLNPPAHYRPHSVGELEFENIKPRPFESELENEEKKMDFRNMMNLSLDGSLEFNGWGTYGCDSENSGDCGEEEKGGKGKESIQSFGPNMKSPTLAKVLAKAKSVRTIKSSRYIVDEKKECSNQMLGRTGRAFHKPKPDSKRRGRAEESEADPPFNNQTEERDGIFRMPKPKPTLLELSDGEKVKTDYENMSESAAEEEAGSTSDKSSSVKDNDFSDSEFEGSEVDRKADEFIAKFREQIRLQKFSSARKGHGVG